MPERAPRLHPVRLDPVLVGERRHLDALLRFDIAPDRGLGHGTDRCRDIAPAHKVGRRDRSDLNSSRRRRLVLPLNLLTISATERVGSAAMKRRTWSGITSIARMVNPYSAATVPMDRLEAGINRRYEHTSGTKRT